MPTSSERVRELTEALRESEDLYQEIFEGQSDALFLIDNETGAILQANGAASAMYGYGVDELLQLTNSDLSAEPAQTKTVTTSTPIQRERVVTIPLRWHRKKDGTCFPVEITGRFFDHRGRPVHVAAIRDISERERAEQDRVALQARLAQAEKLESVGRLAGGVAHDFNNMLVAILGHADLLLEQLAPDDPFHADLMEIHSAARRSADLTRQLLAFARQQVVAPRVIDVNSSVAELLNMLGRLIGEHITLRWSPGAEVWPLEIDPSQLDQILANLCVNARDAIDVAGVVTISTRNVEVKEDEQGGRGGVSPGAYVALTVADDGRGIAPEALEHLFEPFFTTKDVSKGTGLGLATVYGIAKQNGGHVEVVSELGEGTTFEVLLPRATSAALRAHAVAPARPRGGSETVLVVEDEALVRRFVMRQLTRLGYTVLEAATGHEALSLAAAHQGEIALLLTDVIMPKMDGRELAETLAAQRPGLEVIYCSGYPREVIAKRGVLEEGLHFIAKPFATGELARLVRQVLDAVD